METGRRALGVSVVGDVCTRNEEFSAENFHMRGRYEERRRGKLHRRWRREIRRGRDRADAHTDDTRVLQVKTDYKVSVANHAVSVTRDLFFRFQDRQRIGRLVRDHRKAIGRTVKTLQLAMLSAGSRSGRDASRGPEDHHEHDPRVGGAESEAHIVVYALRQSTFPR